jgi:RecB family endonuclease NucS
MVEGREDPIDEERPASSAKERRLRDLIADSPSLLLDDDEHPTAERPAAVSTEVPIRPGDVDVVVVDANGEITIVECKLLKNRDIRRKVIGQLFEYAAAARRARGHRFESCRTRS